MYGRFWQNNMALPAPRLPTGCRIKPENLCWIPQNHVKDSANIAASGKTSLLKNYNRDFHSLFLSKPLELRELIQKGHIGHRFQILQLPSSLLDASRGKYFTIHRPADHFSSEAWRLFTTMFRMYGRNNKNAGMPPAILLRRCLSGFFSFHIETGDAGGALQPVQQQDQDINSRQIHDRGCQIGADRIVRPGCDGFGF